MKLSKIQIGGVVFCLIAIFFLGYTFLQGKLSEPIEAKIAELQNSLSGQAEIDYDKVTVGLLSRNARIHNVSYLDIGTNQKFYVKKIKLNEFDNSSKIPQYIDVGFDGLSYDVSSLGESEHEAFKEFGFNKKSISSDFHINYSYDKEDKMFYLNNLYLGIDNMGEIDAKLSLGNVDLTPEGLFETLFTWPNILLYEGEINFSNKNLVELMFQIDAEEKSVSAEKIKKTYLNDLDFLISTVEPGPFQNIMKKTHDFIENPKKISIQAYPDNPVPFLRVMHAGDEDTQIKLLNLHVES